MFYLVVKIYLLFLLQFNIDNKNKCAYNFFLGNCHKGYYCENKKLQTIDCGKKGIFNYT